MSKSQRVDNRRCKSCIYWRKLSGAGCSRPACHFLLETETRRRKDAAGRCLEYRERSK